MMLAAPAQIVSAIRRVCTDHEEIVAGVKTLVTGSSRENGDITSTDFNRAASISAKLYRGFA